MSAIRGDGAVALADLRQHLLDIAIYHTMGQIEALDKAWSDLKERKRRAESDLKRFREERAEVEENIRTQTAGDLT